MSEVKVCFISSAGGHLEQLRQLNGVESAFDSFFVVPDVAATAQMPERTYRIPVLDHGARYVPRLFHIALKELMILLKEQPTHIISTGAAPAIPMFIIGKMLGAKTIYIESFARRNELNKTGKLLYGKADLFVVQWPELKEKYPEAIYGGWIY